MCAVFGPNGKMVIRHLLKWVVIESKDELAGSKHSIVNKTVAILVEPQ